MRTVHSLRFSSLRRVVSVWLIIFLFSVGQVHSQDAPQTPTADPNTEHTPDLVLKSEVLWGPLNPAQGEASPKAGQLWGDRTDTGAAGFLVRFTRGFSSPPHIHNVTYRGIVITGFIHNDDPSAEKMWLPPGSYWSQPAGDNHITSAKGDKNLAYIEIENGPYLVLPKEKAFRQDEYSVNVHGSNLVWLDASDLVWINQRETLASDKSPELAFLWGSPKDGQLRGSLLKLPAGFLGDIHGQGSFLRAVVIQGTPKYALPKEGGYKTLEPGSYFGSRAKAVHRISVDAETDTIIYIRSDADIKVHSPKANPVQ